MEYGLEFDPHRGVLPFTRSLEGSPIPGDTSIFNKGGLNLPSVRHAHFVPGTDGLIASVPTLLLANVSRISPEPPLAAQAHGRRRGEQTHPWCPQPGLRPASETFDEYSRHGSVSDHDDLAVNQIPLKRVKPGQIRVVL